MNALPTCVRVYHVQALCLWKSEEGLRAIGTGVSDGCGPPMVLGTELGPLQEQQVLLTAEPSLQPCLNGYIFNIRGRIRPSAHLLRVCALYIMYALTHRSYIQKVMSYLL